MKRLRKKGVGGFTLIEAMISIAILSIVIASGAAYDFFVNSYRWSRETFLYVYVYGDMHRAAAAGFKEMIHGVGDPAKDKGEHHKGIQEAGSVDISMPGTIKFVSKSDGLEREFSISNGKVVYTDENDVPTDLIDGDVSSLSFTDDTDGLIGINLILTKTALGKTMTVNLTTSVDLRND